MDLQPKKYPLRVDTYRHLQPFDLVPPGRAAVFFDPADTEAGIWATVDLLAPGAVVLDLGSGSGAAAAAVARAGAARVHGVDVSEESVRWAAEHYAAGEPRLSFASDDYMAARTRELLSRCPLEGPPSIVASNPPYVPMAAGAKTSIDGGPDGLRFVSKVVEHAAAMGADLSLTIGSYTSPRKAAALLTSRGYRIDGVTLGALRLGRATLENFDRVRQLEEAGECALLRPEDGPAHYLLVGLSCRLYSGGSSPGGPSPGGPSPGGPSPGGPSPGGPSPGGASPGDLMELLQAGCRSSTTRLESLDELPEGWRTPVRLLTLPDEPRRHHF